MDAVAPSLNAMKDILTNAITTVKALSIQPLEVSLTNRAEAITVGDIAAILATIITVSVH